MDRDTELAVKLLKSNKGYISDVKAAKGIPNTVAGSILSVTYQIPRQYAERAVLVAMEIISNEKRKAVCR